MTGDGIPSSACTRRTDEIGADGLSSKDWPEQLPANGGDGGDLRRRRRRLLREGRGRFLALGITDSACKNQLVVVSVQYGPFNPYIPIRSTTIDKSRVAKDPIAMRTSWRSNSDIASVTRVSMTFRVVRTNQYNQDLGLIHSTNGNHLKSPNEGSSIDHQVTIYLHALNITMFPTNETCDVLNLSVVITTCSRPLRGTSSPPTSSSSRRHLTSLELTSSSRKSSTASLLIQVYCCFALLLNLQILRRESCIWIVTLHYICFLATGFHVDWIRKACDWIHSNSWFIEALDWMSCCLRLNVQLVRSNACDWLSSWLDQTLATGCPADSSTVTCNWNLLLRFISPADFSNPVPAGSSWPSPDYEQPTQLWTSPLLIQLPSK
ncbi:hypothetical protein F511_33100 [Dorcoceras hygrometricum]|uniref:Uncharacterized protein n=1 Tax=Dorcoceras hygrometricum TaxID=472368 RepID=A0A2Z7AZ56_9LAMI|nr:hypothetical protein F511_33100 [Dorcoceras hygrometricum]